MPNRGLAPPSSEALAEARRMDPLGSVAIADDYDHGDDGPVPVTLTSPVREGGTLVFVHVRPSAADWATGTTYAENSYVVDEGYLWRRTNVSTGSNTSTAPHDDTANWWNRQNPEILPVLGRHVILGEIPTDLYLMLPIVEHANTTNYITQNPHVEILMTNKNVPGLAGASLYSIWRGSERLILGSYDAGEQTLQDGTLYVYQILPARHR